MPSKILLVCFDFPPNEGIGGRRWAKFAKVLAKRGHELHVVKAKPKNNRIHSQWGVDIKSSNIHIYELERTYPTILSNPGTSFADRVKYKIARKKMLSKHKGTIYDDSLGMENAYLAKLREIIKKEKIKNIIVTGAPFNLLNYTAKLKKEYKDLRLIGDYRDPWIDAPNYGMQDLTEKRRAYEIGKQNFVFEHFDYITYPSESLKNELLKFTDKSAGLNCEFKTLTHFYDLDDIDARMLHSKGAKKIRIIYGGTIYQNTESYLQFIGNALDLLSEEHEEVYRKLELEFFTNQTADLKFLSKHKKVVNVQKPIGSDLSGKLKNCNAQFIILGTHNKDYQTTKFMESLPYRKPLVYIGPEGGTSAFILSNSLGTCISSPQDFVDFVLKINADEFQWNTDFDVTKYSLNAVCTQLETYLISN